MRPLAIVGPTGGGKSKLALELAEIMPIEIISMDSMAVYKDAAIVTAQPSLQEQKTCPHHLINFVDVSSDYSASQWRQEALEACRNLASGTLPVFVGGSFLYLSALIKGLHDLPGADQALRDEHLIIFENEGPEALWKQLEACDPESATALHMNDFKRVSRALEIFHITGQPRNALFTIQTDVLDVATVFLNWERDQIYQRCDNRVDQMIDMGLIPEMEALQNKDLSPGFRQAVGVKEVLSFINGDYDKSTMLIEMKKKTRHLAKHQYTWSKRFEMKMLNPKSDSLLEDLLCFIKAEC